MKKTEVFKTRYFVFNDCQQFVKIKGPNEGSLITLIFLNDRYYNYSLKSAEEALIKECLDGSGIYLETTEEEWSWAFNKYLNYVKSQLAKVA